MITKEQRAEAGRLADACDTMYRDNVTVWNYARSAANFLRIIAALPEAEPMNEKEIRAAFIERFGPAFAQAWPGECGSWFTEGWNARVMLAHSPTYANPAKADHLHEPYTTIKAAGQRDRRIPVPTNFANAASAPPPDAQQTARIAELEAALETARNGLLWYHDTYPEAVNECDEEAIAGIEAILKEETM